MPQTFEDRQFYAEFDRPMSGTENQIRNEMMKKAQANNFKPKRYRHIWYRHPTCGGNRWSTRPPKWYPQQWFMRKDRQNRLTGQGRVVNGHRGPWGNLARFGATSRPGV